MVHIALSRSNSVQTASRGRLAQRQPADVRRRWLPSQDLRKARLVKPGGRIAVMSYHSLEDRRVKRLLRTGDFSDQPPPTDAYGNRLVPWTPLTRQAIVPSDAEIAANSRARSVRLRVGERTEYPV